MRSYQFPVNEATATLQTVRRTTTKMKRKNTEFLVLKAYNGDCFLIKTFNSNYDEIIILIDGGTPSTFNYSLKKELSSISKINLLILTHIDSDHIGGLIKFFKNSIVDKIEISEIWVNHPELVDINSGELISFKQGNDLKKLIVQKKSNAKIQNISNEDKSINLLNIKFTILSPTKEIINSLYSNWEGLKPQTQQEKENVSSKTDINTYNIDLETLSKLDFKPNNSIKSDLVNASSISFILTCPDKTILFLADSRSELIEKELKELDYTTTNKLDCDFVKISHHGSKNNTSNSLLELIDCSNFIISTNGGSSNHRHPSRETIARIIYNSARNFKNEVSIFTNYPINEIKNKIGDFITVKDLEYGNWKIENKNKF